MFIYGAFKWIKSGLKLTRLSGVWCEGMLQACGAVPRAGLESMSLPLHGGRPNHGA